MTHWGWYWKYKRNHRAKGLCSWFCYSPIDSFSMFRNKEIIRLIKESNDRTALTIPQYDFTATIQDDDSLRVTFKEGSYIIPVEQKTCNFGGFYYFFHCPACKARMRKLYCIQGVYLCRKCAHLGYRSQRLRPSERCNYMKMKVEEKINARAGTLKQKPPWIKEGTFQKLRIKYVKYDEKHSDEVNKELLEMYDYEGDWYFPPSDLLDAYVEREVQREG